MKSFDRCNSLVTTPAAAATPTATAATPNVTTPAATTTPTATASTRATTMTGAMTAVIFGSRYQK